MERGGVRKGFSSIDAIVSVLDFEFPSIACLSIAFAQLSSSAPRSATQEREEEGTQGTHRLLAREKESSRWKREEG